LVQSAFQFGEAERISMFNEYPSFVATIAFAFWVAAAAPLTIQTFIVWMSGHYSGRPVKTPKKREN
jgi:hypothetical protein